jgi:enoyl-[acyl-carrier protein] reductase III
VVRNGALEHFATFREEGQALIDEVLAQTPAGRLCTPEDVADVVTYLCTAEAALICGQTIIVDGGYSLLAR